MADFGLDSSSYHLHLEDANHPRDTRWFLDRILELGLQGCSFSPRHLCGWDEAILSEIGQFCGHHNLYLELTSSALDYARLCRRLIVASQVGARMVRTFIADIQPHASEAQRRTHVRFAIENLKRLGDVAECVGVFLGIGNKSHLTTAELSDVLAQVNSPFVRASFCNAEVLTTWEDPVDAAIGLSSHTVSVMIKDWRVYRNGALFIQEDCALGEGDAKVADVYRVLRNACPRAPITLEVPLMSATQAVHSLQDEEARVTQGLAFLRALDKQPSKVSRN